MTPPQRQQHLHKLMSAEVKLPESQLHDDAGAGPKPTESRPKSTDAIRHISMSFEESGLSRLVHAGSWQKANELVAKENAMYPVPVTQNNQAFFVESARGGQTSVKRHNGYTSTIIILVYPLCLSY